MGLALIVVAALFAFVVVSVAVAAVRNGGVQVGPDATARIATQRLDSGRSRTRHTV